MNFKDKFDQFFKTANLGDEWVYSNFTDFILEGITPEGAFSLLPEVAEFLLEQTDEYLRLQILNLLGTLAGKTNSTEIPPALLPKLDAIEKLIENDDDYTKSRFDVLKKWYRIKA